MADDPNKGVFELHLVGRVSGLGQAVSVPQQNDPSVNRKRHDQEKVRKVAVEYAEEALLKYVDLMRNDPDSRIQLQAADRILNRSIGMAKALSEEEKKGADAGSILDVLAAVSIRAAAIEQRPPDAPAIEHDPQVKLDGEQAFPGDIYGDTEDAVIVND